MPNLNEINLTELSKEIKALAASIKEASKIPLAALASNSNVKRGSNIGAAGFNGGSSNSPYYNTYMNLDGGDPEQSLEEMKKMQQSLKKMKKLAELRKGLDLYFTIMGLHYPGIGSIITTGASMLTDVIIGGKINDEKNQPFFKGMEWENYGAGFLSGYSEYKGKKNENWKQVSKPLGLLDLTLGIQGTINNFKQYDEFSDAEKKLSFEIRRREAEERLKNGINNYTPSPNSQNPADQFWVTHSPDLPDYLKRKDNDETGSHENKKNKKFKPSSDDLGMSFGLASVKKSFDGMVSLFNSKLNSSKNQQRKSSGKKKKRIPPKPQTTPDEDFGDEFLNKTYNTTKSALELGNAKFDKSKLLVESINFENAYLKAFDKEIDYKKEIGILQDELSKLEGDDLATKQKQLELKSKINSLEEEQKNSKINEINKYVSEQSAKIQNMELKGDIRLVDEIDDMRKQLRVFLTDDTLSNATQVFIRNLIESYDQLYDKKSAPKIIPPERKPKTAEDVRIERETKQKKDSKDKADSDAGITKENRKDPLALFGLMVKHASQLGSSMQSLMNTLNVGADTFVGKLVSGFNTTLSIISDVLSIFQTIKNIQAIGSALKAIPFLSWLPFAEGGSIPGTGDTDTVPAMLTPGEFVIKKSVVNKFGTQFFEHINGGGFSSSIIGRYANGGIVAAVPPRPQKVAVSVPDVKLKGSDLYLSWRRENITYDRRSI